MFQAIYKDRPTGVAFPCQRHALLSKIRITELIAVTVSLIRQETEEGGVA